MPDSTTSEATTSEKPLTFAEKISFLSNYRPSALKKDGSNFVLWEKDVLDVFTITDLLDFIEDEEYALVNKDTHSHRLVMQALKRSLDESTKRMASRAVTSYELWNKLSTEFQPKTLIAQVSHVRDLADLRYRGGSLSAHIDKADDIFDAMEASGWHYDASLRATWLLASLPHSFNNIVTVLSTNSITDPSSIRSALLDHEKRSRLAAMEDKQNSPPAAAFVAHNKSHNHADTLFCKSCGRRHRSNEPCRKNQPQPGPTTSSQRDSASWRNPAPTSTHSTRPSTHQAPRPQARQAHLAQVSEPVDTSFMLDTTEEKAQLNIQAGAYSASLDCSSIASLAPADTGENSDNEPIAQSAVTSTSPSVNTPSCRIIIDSGASHHFINQPEWFNTKAPITPKPISIASHNSAIEAVAVGNVSLDVQSVNAPSNLALPGALFVPLMPVSLVSVSQLCKQGYSVNFISSTCVISKSGQNDINITPNTNSGLFELKVVRVPSAMVAVDLLTAHGRLGHINFDFVRRAANLGIGLSLKSSKQPDCTGCRLGKSTKLSVPAHSISRAAYPGQLLHSDVCGPFKPAGLGLFNFFLVIIDDHSRLAILYPLRAKSEVASHIKACIALHRTAIGATVKTLRTDRGGEFSSNELNLCLRDHGITHQQPPAESSPQNGVSERFIRTITGLIRAMLYSTGLPTFLWVELAKTAVFVMNRTPLSTTTASCPISIWSGITPDLSILRVVGCQAFAHLTSHDRDKLSPQAVECFVVGYEPNTKDAYRLWCPTKRSIIVSRDVRFNEDILFNHNTTTLPIAPPSPPANSVVTAINTSDDMPSTSVEVEQPHYVAEEQSARPQRTRRHTVPFWHMADYAQALFVNYNSGAEPALAAFISVQAATMHRVPRSFKEAMTLPNHIEWKKAFDAEMAAIARAGTWDLVPLPPGRKALGSTWVCRIKSHANGSVDKLKCRIVAQGFTQIEGIDYLVTFAPVAKLSTIRILFALAASLGWIIHHVDVDSAYLNGTLDEEVFMRQPEGYVVKGKEHLVCKLKKSLYGLKQAGRVWYDHLCTALLSSGFTICVSDPCLFIKRSDNESVWIIVYVDDIAIISPSLSVITEVKATLATHFTIKDLGEVKSFLGIEIRHDTTARSIVLSQRAYVESVAQQFESDNCRPVSTPLPVGLNLADADHASSDPADRAVYQSLLGSLMYLMLATRPDIAFAVTYLSQFSSAPTATHMRALRHLLRYAISTADLSLVYSANGTVTPVGLSDADFAGNPIDRKSINGFIFMLAGAAVTWNAKKQTLVALSTTEAEYIALSHAGREAIWIRSLLREVGFAPTNATDIHCDNLGAIALTSNSTFHARSKHFDIKLHWIRDCIRSKDLHIEFIPTDVNTADLFTKPLPTRRHQALTQALGLVPA